MRAITQAIYDRLSQDGTLVGWLSKYQGGPAVFTTDPAPGDAVLPFIVTAGQVTDSAFDTKTSQGRQVWRDVRCYAEANGDASLVEDMAERVRTLLHRHRLAIDGQETWVAECSGPVKADEQDVYGRVVTVRLIFMEV